MRFEGRVPVCVRCGSRDVHPQTTAEGLWPGGGEGALWACDACHHLGAPFLVDEAPTPAAWEAEYADSAAGLDDEAWAATRPAGRRVLSGAVFMALGAFFLVVVALAFLQAAAHPHPWAFARALAGTGWLLAIGLALMVAGARLVRRDRPMPDSGTDTPGDPS